MLGKQNFKAVPNRTKKDRALEAKFKFWMLKFDGYIINLHEHYTTRA